MGEGDCVANREKRTQQPRQRPVANRRRILRLQLLQDRVERAALNALHRVVNPALVIHAQVMNWNNRRMLHLPGDLRLFHKTQDVFRRRQSRIEHSLQRHIAPNREILRIQHRTHPAARDFVANRVLRIWRGWPQLRQLLVQRNARLLMTCLRQELGDRHLPAANFRRLWVHDRRCGRIRHWNLNHRLARRTGNLGARMCLGRLQLFDRNYHKRISRMRLGGDAECCQLPIVWWQVRLNANRLGQGSAAEIKRGHPIPTQPATTRRSRRGQAIGRAHSRI